MRLKGREAEREWLSQQKNKNAKPFGEPPVKHRLIVQDTTPEKLVELLQNDALLMELDELALLINRCSQKGRESYRASLLQTWQGNQAAMIDTVGGGERYANPACLSIFGCTQPDKVTEIFRSIFNGRSGDGLENRFQCIAILGNQKDPEDIERDLVAAEFLNQLVRKFHSKEFVFAKKLKFSDEVEGFCRIHFPEPVARAFADWDKALRCRRNGIASAPIQSHLSKMDKLLVSLVAIFSLARQASEGERSDPNISMEDFVFAQWWVGFFENQFLRLIGTSGDPVLQTAHTLLEYFQAGVFETGVTMRDIHRSQRRGLKDAVLVLKALSLLEKHNMIQIKKESSSVRVWLVPEVPLINNPH